MVDVAEIYLFDIHAALGHAFDQLLHAGGMTKVASRILAMQTYLYILVFPLILLFKFLGRHEPYRNQELLAILVDESIHRNVL